MENQGYIFCKILGWWEVVGGWEKIKTKGKRKKEKSGLKTHLGGLKTQHFSRQRSSRKNDGL